MLNRLLRFIAAVACLGLATLSPLSMAHERIGSYSHAVVIVQGSQVNYYLNLPPAAYTLLRNTVGDNANDVLDFFRAEVTLNAWDSECPLTSLVQAPPLASGNRIIEMHFECPAAVADLTITSTLFLDQDESHTQFIRLAPPAEPGKVLHEAVLNASNNVFHVADVKTGGEVSFERALSFLKLGIEHLLTGYDHILFLLTIIISLSFIESLKAVTSFTLAHSLTMALAFLGAFSLSSNIVEPLIALTVIYVAIENFLRKSVRRRWIWTFFFGLVHGLGFVGALKLITISRSELLISLASFNIGIELGQLLVVAVALTLFRFLRRYSWYPSFQRIFSIGVAVLGMIWLVQRLLET